MCYYEQGRESSVRQKSGEFLYHLSDYHLLQNDPSPWVRLSGGNLQTRDFASLIGSDPYLLQIYVCNCIKVEAIHLWRRTNYFAPVSEKCFDAKYIFGHILLYFMSYRAIIFTQCVVLHFWRSSFDLYWKQKFPSIRLILPDCYRKAFKQTSLKFNV